MKKLSVTKALKLLPDFCWMTYEEVVWYVEQISDKADYFNVGPCLRRLIKSKIIEMKKTYQNFNKGEPRTICMYKKNSNNQLVKK